MDTTEHGAHQSASRRRVLQALGLGGIIAAVPVAGSAARAQDAATTTTAPPKSPTQADQALLGLAQSYELAAAAIYQAGIDGAGGLDKVDGVVAVMASHHTAYANALSGLLGRHAPNAAAQSVLDKFGDAAADDGAALLAELEQSLASTHVALLGQVESTDGAALLASIASAETRHALYVGGADLADALMPSSGVLELSAALPTDEASA
mgnify:CR=1 FL=1